MTTTPSPSTDTETAAERFARVKKMWQDVADELASMTDEELRERAKGKKVTPINHDEEVTDSHWENQ